MKSGWVRGKEKFSKVGRAPPAEPCFPSTSKSESEIEPTRKSIQSRSILQKVTKVTKGPPLLARNPFSSSCPSFSSVQFRIHECRWNWCFENPHELARAGSVLQKVRNVTKRPPSLARNSFGSSFPSFSSVQSRIHECRWNWCFQNACRTGSAGGLALPRSLSQRSERTRWQWQTKSCENQERTGENRNLESLRILCDRCVRHVSARPPLNP